MLHMVAQTAVHVSGTIRLPRSLGRKRVHWHSDELRSRGIGEVGAELQRIGSATRITWWDEDIHFQVLVTKAMVRPGDTMETLLQRAERRFEKDPGVARQIPVTRDWTSWVSRRSG